MSLPSKARCSREVWSPVVVVKPVVVVVSSSRGDSRTRNALACLVLAMWCGGARNAVAVEDRTQRRERKNIALCHRRRDAAERFVIEL